MVVSYVNANLSDKGGTVLMISHVRFLSVLFFSGLDQIHMENCDISDVHAPLYLNQSVTVVGLLAHVVTVSQI